jgi:NADPH:quinone reductase-like Zn-dependent oxidoreductase
VAGFNPGDTVLVTGASGGLGVHQLQLVRALAAGGIAVVLGNIGGEAVPISPGMLIGRRLRVQGSGMAPVDEVRQALALIAAGAVKPVISAVVGFAEAPKAHRMLEERAVEGRVILEGW